MLEFFKVIDGKIYIIYVCVLVLFILALIGYVSERKKKELQEEESRREMAILEHQKAKAREQETVASISSIQQQPGVVQQVPNIPIATPQTTATSVTPNTTVSESTIK